MVFWVGIAKRDHTLRNPRISRLILIICVDPVKHPKRIGAVKINRTLRTAKSEDIGIHPDHLRGYCETPQTNSL
jgi:hypothetical protein